VTASVSRAAAGASELRALRLLTAMIAVTALAATVGAGFATGLPNAGAAPPVYRVALSAAVVVPLLAGVAAPSSGTRMLRLLNAGTVIAFTSLLVGFVLLELPTLGRAAQIPWFLTVTAAPVTAALVAWGRGVAWVSLGALTALVQVTRTVSQGDTQDAIANDTFAFFAAATLLLLTGQFVAASRQFDAATAVAATAAAKRSADEAERAAAERLRLLVHDEVLSTLSLAARVAPSLREAVGRQAARARRLIRELPSIAPDAPADPRQRRTAELATRLAHLVDEVAPEADFVVARVSTPPTSVPTEVDDAVLAAARQALLNSVVHAGDGVRRTVTLRHDGGGLLLTVHDDGRGFDPDAVAPHRMGLAESVLGRMRSLPGGTARVASRPRGGTTVELAWEPATAEAGEADTATTASVVLAHGAATRLSIVAIALLLLAQAALAVLAAARTGEPMTHVFALAGVASGFAVLSALGPEAPSRRRTALVAALVLATAAVSWLPVTRDGERYGDVWYIAALGFVLVVLAMHARPRTALLTAVGVALVALLGVLVQHNDGTDVVAATTRMLAIVGIGFGFARGIARVRARTTTLRDAELRAVREESYRAATARQLRGRTAELEALIGDLLERLAGADELDADMRRECVVLEGRLRDGYRAGRLARGPLMEAAAAARARGVDVALFDDPEARELSDGALEEVVSWLAARLDDTHEGHFTGRVLPSDRAAWASAATEVSVVEWHPSHP
jgi:signal transduction histidine kinase